MSLYNDASLVMIPSAYKDGKLYSIKPTDGSGDFTFSRGSNLAATRVDENGLIEKGRENLYTQSNNFSHSDWTPRAGTFTQGVSDPNGGTDAWIWEATNTDPFLYQNKSLSGVYALSIYIKGIGSTIGENIQIRVGGALKDVVLTNDWQRVEHFGVLSGSTNIGFEYGNPATAGDIVHIYAAQLEAGLVATDYIETTTTTAQAGILEDMPRLDYSGSCPSLLLEPQRTNGNAHSEYFSGAGFGIVAATATPNAATSPEGVSNATSFIGAASSAEHIIYTTGASTYNGDVTISIFAKANGYDYFVLGAGAQSANKPVLFNIANGTIVGNFTGWSSYGAPIDSDIKDYGNGWYRLSVTFAATTGTNTNMFFGSMPTDSVASNISTQNGTDGSYIYGAQIEAASYPTSYIPCYGAATTRSQDLTTADTSSFYTDSSSGTLFSELSFSLAADGNYNGWFFWNGSTYHRIVLQRRGDTGRGQVEVRINNTTQASIISSSAITLEDNHKMLVRWNNNEFTFFIDGVNIGSDTSTDSYSGTNLNELASRPTYNAANIKQAVLFPTALTDSECIALTTI